MDREREQKSQIQSVLEKYERVKIEYSPSYAAESNWRSERLVEELTLQARVLLTGLKLSSQLWERLCITVSSSETGFHAAALTMAYRC